MKIKQNKTIVIFAFCILTQISYAQNKQTMLQTENLKGKVKSVYITNEDSTYLKVWFDKSGKITRKERGEREYIMVWDNFVYNQENRLTSISIYSTDNPADKYELTYKYSDDGIRESYNATYKYDERGNCLLETRQRGHGNEYVERIYNEKNQLIEAFSHNGPVGLNVWITDSNGNSYEETEWTEPEKRKYMIFKYNKFGDISLITLKTDNEYTPLNKNCAITYKRYDNAGNWLERTIPDMLDDEYSIYGLYSMLYCEIYETHLEGFHIKRVIEYYK